MVSNERIQALDFPGPTGRLEGLLHTSESASLHRIAVVCHPHPLFGGTMHNKVVHRIDRVLFHLGHSVLRFNFRGVGRSEGSFDNGVGENDDVRAALDALASRWPDCPATLAGFSFGASRALCVGWTDGRVDRIIAVGAPATAFEPVLSGSTLHVATKPVLVAHGTVDELAPFLATQQVASQLAGPVTFAAIEGGDHFLTEKLDALETHIRAFFG